MQALALTVASNVALAAGLAVVVFGVTRIWRNPQLAHALWLLVLIKLVTPPVTWVSLPAHWFEPGRPDAAARASAGLKPAAGAVSQSAAASASIAVAEGPEQINGDPAAVEHSPPLEILSQAGRPRLLATDPPSAVEGSPWEFHVTSSAVGNSIESNRPQELAHGDGRPTGTIVDRGGAGTLGLRRESVPRAAHALTSGAPPAEDGLAMAPRPGSPNSTSKLDDDSLAFAAGAFALIVWLGGAAAFMAVLASRCRRVKQILAASAEADQPLLLEVRRLAKMLGLGRVPDVRVVKARIPPLVWGAGRRPLVLLPRELMNDLSPAERRSVLVHELAHIRRGDHLVRWLEIVILVLFWWNPVAWWSRRQLRIAEEECCDAWVVWALPDSRRSYGRALLRTIEFLTEPRTATAMAASPFGRFPFRRRIEMILKRELSRRMSWSGCILVAGLAISVLPVAAQTAADDPPATTSPAAADQPAVSTVPDVAPPAVPDTPSLTPATTLPVPADLPAVTPAAAPPQPTSVAQPPIVSSTTAQEIPASADQARDATPPPAQSSRTLIPDTTDSVTPPAADHARLEARIARLEALVERLIAQQERGRAADPAAATGRRPRIVEGFAVESPRVATVQSPDGKLTASLRVGDSSSTVEIQDSTTGRLMSKSELGGRATGIEFINGERLSITLPGHDSILDVPTGRLLHQRPTDSEAANPLAADPNSQPQSPAQTEFLREWTPQRKLLEIDLQQAELQVQAAKRKLAALQELRESKAIPAADVDQQELEVRQAELNVTRVQTQLELHQSKRTAFEEESLRRPRPTYGRFPTSRGRGQSGRGDELREYPVAPGARNLPGEDVPETGLVPARP